MDAHHQGAQHAWPCHIATWLPLPSPLDNSANKQVAVTKTNVTGHWIASKSKERELISVTKLQGTHILKITCSGGRALLSAPVSRPNFAFALLNEGFLVGSVAGPLGVYTFGCRFVYRQHAVECATAMAAALSNRQPSDHAAAGGLRQDHQAALLLMQAVTDDPEKAGNGWWGDFSNIVNEFERQWPPRE